MAIAWNTRTQVASGGVGSYAHDSSSDYTFRIYATASRTGATASILIEYTAIANNTYAGYEDYSGPEEYLYVDNTQRSHKQISAIWPRYQEQTLATYTKTLTADAEGKFASTTVRGVWVRNGSSGYAPKDLTISGTVELSDLPSYTVQFNSNGGSGTIANATKYDGIGLVLPSSGFTKTGYHMTAWRKGSTSGTAYALGGTYSDNEATTMYAIWTINTYSVRFNANGGSGSMSNESFTYGETKALTSNAFTRQGYAFKGWATSASGDVVYTDGESVSNLTGEDGVIVDLYAVWAKSGMRVKYNGSWKDGEVYAKVNGEWKSGQVYAKDGTWKEGS